MTTAAVNRLPERPAMPLADDYGLRLARGLDSVNARRMVEGERGLVWKWNIAANAAARKHEMRYLVREINDRESTDIFLAPLPKILGLLLGGRKEWSVTEVSNLLLCSQEHVHALLRAKALARCSKRGEQIRIGRSALELFFTVRLA